MPSKHAASQTTIKKAIGLLKKIECMIEADAYCIDVMQQNLAAIGLLKSAHQSLLEEHLRTCVAGAMRQGNPEDQERRIQEIITVTKLAGK